MSDMPPSYEYKVVLLMPNEEYHLNELALAGWFLIGVVATPSGTKAFLAR